MICEVVAVGTELLLGPSVDTNSTWIGERLAENGVDSFFHTVVGDNKGRIVEALRIALERSDTVVVTGGLGPTQDDITREAVAEVMGAELVFDADVAAHIAALFATRKREMAESNLRQAWRPNPSVVIPNGRGTAPGLICDVGGKAVFLLPGVPHEMQAMVTEVVLPELRSRSGATSVIASRHLGTWGVAESTLAEMVAPRLEALEAAGSNPTLAFLAHGINGIHLRITAKAETIDVAKKMLDDEETELRALLGPLVFGVDDDTMESAVGRLLVGHGLTLGVAESLTGGLIGARLTSVAGAGAWLRGGVVSYASDVKRDVLGVPDGPVVTPEAAKAMAEGARRVLDADVGIGITGVAGPDTQEGQEVGTVFGAIAAPWSETAALQWHLSGDRQRVRELACINLLDALRLNLLLHSGD